MQIRLTVLGPRGGRAARACDVLVTAPAGTALAAVASGLAAAVAASSGSTGIPGSSAAEPAAPGSSGTVVLYAGTERLDAQRCALGEPPLTDGAVLSLHAPAEPGRHPGVPLEAPSDASAQLHVVAGPDAGGVHLLHGGQIRIGRSADADVPLDDPDVSRLHCAVTVAEDGGVTVADLGSTNGTALDGAPLDSRPAALRPGALIRLGESALRLVDPGSPPGPAAGGRGAPLRDALPVVPDGEGHFRVALFSPGSPDSSPASPGSPASPSSPVSPVPPAGGAAGVPASATGHVTGPLTDRGLAGPGDTPHVPAARAAEGSTRAGAEGAEGTAAATAHASWPGGTTAGPAPGEPGGSRAGGTADPRDPRAAGPADADAHTGAPGTPPRPAGPPSTPGTAVPPAPPLPVPPSTDSPFGPGSPVTAGSGTGAGGLLPPAPRTEPDPSPTARTTRDDRPGPVPSQWASGSNPPGVTAGSDPGARDPQRPPAPHTEPPRPRWAIGDDQSPPQDSGSAADHGPARAQGPGDGHSHAHGHGHAEDTHLGHPDLMVPWQAAPHPAPVEPGPRSPRRARGIGAWARRLAGGREEARVVYEAAPQTSPGAQPEPPAHETAGQERWPDPADVLLTALGPGPRLWERRPGHAEALVVRLGTADRPGSPSVPVTAGLRQVGSLGLAGPRARLSGLTRSVVAQLAALHSPTDLEIVLISADRARDASERLAEWSWLGWLPQLRPAHGQDCRLLLAYDRDQATARTAELVRRLDDGPLGTGWVTADRAAVAAAAQRYEGPYTVVIVDGDPGSAALRGTTARLAAGGPAAGIHLLCLAETPAASPASPLSATLEVARTASPPFSECGAAALLSGDVATALRVMPLGPAGPVNNGVMATVDAVSAAWAERFARALAPLRPADVSAGFSRRAAIPLPRTSRLLDELGLARATPASLTARWAAAADAGQAEGGRISAVLGTGPHGPLAVDPAAEGPHLLIEGGPGTGKTELLRSLAASLAAADRPDRVSLALVDGGGAERGEGLRVCTELPHVSTYLAASDPVRMREFAQALSTELKRRAELLGGLDFVAWHEQRTVAARLVSPRRSGESPATDRQGDVESTSSVTLKLRARSGGRSTGDGPPPAGTGGSAQLPRLVVLVDDFDALVAPALGSPGRPAAGSVVRALEAVARDGERLGVHLIAATGRPDRTAETAAAERADLRIALDILPARADGPDAGEASAGRGRLLRRDGSTTPFQAGRVTGRIPRTATLRPTVVPLDWERMGDPPARRPVRELGNGPTDLALLASALQRAAQSAQAPAAPPLL
ncbi:FtsK/SpoIIIE domain-containing protein [Streptomyces sp. NPDC004647]|uniref:FtsK/SpoIIIE domain-containing protein n=1 Tax=Streptomyces sp. NPDC004647 TaxID=3154671 RepID=UPI0033A796BD